MTDTQGYSVYRWVKFFVPDFNKLPYLLRSQGDNIKVTLVNSKIAINRGVGGVKLVKANNLVTLWEWNFVKKWEMWVMWSIFLQDGEYMKIQSIYGQMNKASIIKRYYIIHIVDQPSNFGWLGDGVQLSMELRLTHLPLH